MIFLTIYPVKQTRFYEATGRVRKKELEAELK